jgi:hypothetical protein
MRKLRLGWQAELIGRYAPESRPMMLKVSVVVGDPLQTMDAQLKIITHSCIRVHLGGAVDGDSN